MIDSALNSKSILIYRQFYEIIFQYSILIMPMIKPQIKILRESDPLNLNEQ